MSTILAFDFGEKRTGVAVGETALKQAHPLAVIQANDDTARIKAIDRLIAEWRPERLVVGLPTHVDGTPHAMSARVRAFSESLRARFSLPVVEADERLTSRDAQSRLLEVGRTTRTMKPILDAVAAQLILQTWFDFSFQEAPS
ncbi:MAG: Holliday junction resolvase RuvX [Zoogloeaceae bacterium]|jgi:putative Holliday junction resolvase|nr:Holliday junction resolvase RuvX [Zoogloeaceae bacterium]